jgi:hypothetical protein
MSARATGFLRFALVVAAAATALIVSPFRLGGATADGGLLPNGDFEQSALEPDALAGRSPQGVLPTGWAFEGAAELFDHANGGPGASHRMAAISGSLGGKRDVCAQPPVGCNHNPGTEVKDAARGVYTVDPAWRNAVPVDVVAGHTYTLAADVSWELVTEGEGVIARVRWIGTDGSVVSTSDAWRVVSNASTSAFRPWGNLAGAVTAPSGATKAVVLLGATEDTWIGQVRFDNAYFG